MNYLKASEKAEIVIKGRYEDGTRLESKIEVRRLTRPDESLLKKICDRLGYGKAEFEDMAVYRHDGMSARITLAELYYSGKLVGMREFPGIFMFSGDSLELTWRLWIERNNILGVIT